MKGLSPRQFLKICNAAGVKVKEIEDFVVFIDGRGVIVSDKFFEYIKDKIVEKA